VGHGGSRTALADELVGTKTQIECKRCGSSRIFRLHRQGFLRKQIYPLFGYYPWKCKTCSEEMMFRHRKRSKSKENLEAE
jgi:DNA-directed RNA polymerase subunit RPC12/RpoP